MPRHRVRLIERPNLYLKNIINTVKAVIEKHMIFYNTSTQYNIPKSTLERK